MNTDRSVVVEDHSLELGFRTEVEEQTYLNLSGFEAIQQLCFVGGLQRPRGLQLDYDEPLNEEVGSEQPDLKATEPDLEWYLAFDTQA